jgi:hypothetical protein
VSQRGSGKDPLISQSRASSQAVDCHEDPCESPEPRTAHRQANGPRGGAVVSIKAIKALRCVRRKFKRRNTAGHHHKTGSRKFDAGNSPVLVIHQESIDRRISPRRSHQPAVTIHTRALFGSIFSSRSCPHHPPHARIRPLSFCAFLFLALLCF